MRLFRDTTVDGASVNCPILMFLGKVPDNLDVLTTIIQKGLFSKNSITALATCGQLLSVLCGDESTKNESLSVVRITTGASLLGGIVLYFANLNLSQYVSDVSPPRVLTSFSGGTAASFSKL